MTNLSIPYYAEEASLPAPLPTAEEMESATEILTERGAVSSNYVRGIGEHFVVKYGACVNLQEGRTMLFLKSATNVPVPRVYALFQKPKSNNRIYSYIVMERIRGPTLASIWPKMGQMEKEVVASQLRHVLQEMRGLESPGGYCSIGRRGLADSLFDFGDDSASYNGPFDTESNLNEAMIARHAIEGYSEHKMHHFERAFKDVFQNHPPVFTHADFQKKNIMIREPPTRTTEDGLVQWASIDLKVVIIDWEYSGWYPSYWEYARALFGCGAWKNDWSDWLENLMEPYRNEYAWVLLFLTELFS